MMVPLQAPLVLIIAQHRLLGYSICVMNQKFEDLMRPGLGRSLLSPVEEPPDSVRWVNLLSTACFVTFCTLMSHPDGWQDGLFFVLFYGMIFGPVIFLMTTGFATMCGGKGSWWVSVSCLVIISIICGYFLYGSYGLDWLY